MAPGAAEIRESLCSRSRKPTEIQTLGFLFQMLSASGFGFTLREQRAANIYFRLGEIQGLNVPLFLLELGWGSGTRAWILGNRVQKPPKISRRRFPDSTTSPLCGVLGRAAEGKDKFQLLQHFSSPFPHIFHASAWPRGSEECAGVMAEHRWRQRLPKALPERTWDRQRAEAASPGTSFHISHPPRDDGDGELGTGTGISGG